MTIAFGGAVSLKYDPPCVTVSKDTKVTFKGYFSIHPLRAGEVKAGEATPDPNSPIKDTDVDTNKDLTASFILTEAGSYPYYCSAHLKAGMFGAIFVK